MFVRLGSIRTQLQMLAAFSAATALLVACSAFVVHDMRVMATNKRQQLYRYAAVVGRNAGPELAKGDWEAAKEQLATLRLEPTVTAACLYDANGCIVATYRRDAVTDLDYPIADDSAWMRDWNQDELALFQPVYRTAVRVGSLFLRSTRDDIHQQRAAYPLIVGVVFLISLGVAAAFASRMQSRISSPIEALARTAERISSDGDYSARVMQAPSGQVGELCLAFNAMLDRIETTDNKLQTARDELNARVRERTRELHREVLERRYAESIASGQTLVLQQLATGRSLPEVLTALVNEIDSHISKANAAISVVEPDDDWFDEPLGVQLSGPQREGLRQLPISGSGSAPARAAASRQPQFDLARDKSPDGTGFDSTAHGGACWAHPVVTPDGRLLAVISVFHRQDRQPNEEEFDLLQSAGSLAGLAIEQRNGEAALKDAMRKATEANRAKSDFLANMSHEIRTPLNAILGFADLLTSDADDLDDERRNHLHTISSSGRHLLDLINDILDLSKIESSQLRVDLAPTDPNQVLAEVMSLLRVKAVEKGVSLDCEWRTSAPKRIITDPARLRQLIVNLVGNAVKFTNEGSVRVIASIEESEIEGPRLQVEVNDTGVGIADDKLTEIFNPFVQADASVTRQFGGTGLGLAICRRLAEAMGGELTVTSRLREGSCFTLRLPTGSLDSVERVRPPVCDGLQAAPRPTEAAVDATPDLTGLQVLVVDDGETNRRLIDLVLRRAGANVEMATNGREGVDAALACHFDAVLMDMQMPVMDGYTAAGQLRTADYTGPIIALTAHAMKGDERRCLDAGCSDYLTKPIDSGTLITKIARACPRPVMPSNEATPATAEPRLIASRLPTDDDEFRMVVEQFLTKCAEEFGVIETLLEGREWDRLREKAHWLKGSGGTAGYPELSDVASELEGVLAGEPDRDAVRVAVERLLDLNDRLVVTLEPTVA